MNFTVIDAEQRSAAWFEARLGRVTGSVAKHVLSKGRGSEESVGKADLRTQLACEITTRIYEPGGFVNDAMLRGIELEPKAFAAYESLTGTVAQKSGFLSHDTYLAGCSLDGHVQDFAGIIELKCPKSKTHWGYLKAGKVPSEYLPQITHNLWITGAEWCDFMSFDDRMLGPLQTFLVRVHRDDVDVLAYEAAVLKFMAEVQAEVAAMRTMAEGVAA